MREKLVREHFEDRDGDVTAETFSGPQYMDPKALLEGIEKDGIDAVIVVRGLKFPPTAYESVSIRGSALQEYAGCLRGADGKDSWETAVRLIEKAAKRGLSSGK